MHNTNIESKKRYQCRHIFIDGRRCGSACLRQEEFCYYHHTTRQPIQNPRQRRSRRTSFNIPQPEDRSAIQHSIGEVLSRIASNDIDPRRAGLLLYGLQIASLNLPKVLPSRRSTPEIESVEEITLDPIHGPLAPKITVEDNRPGIVAQLLRMTALPDDPDTSTEQEAIKPLASPRWWESPKPVQSTDRTSPSEPVVLPELQASSHQSQVPHPFAFLAKGGGVSCKRGPQSSRIQPEKAGKHLCPIACFCINPRRSAVACPLLLS